VSVSSGKSIGIPNGECVTLHPNGSVEKVCVFTQSEFGVYVDVATSTDSASLALLTSVATAQMNQLKGVG
jgi:hypothetical protein